MYDFLRNIQYNNPLDAFDSGFASTLKMRNALAEYKTKQELPDIARKASSGDAQAFASLAAQSPDIANALTAHTKASKEKFGMAGTGSYQGTVNNIARLYMQANPELNEDQAIALAVNEYRQKTPQHYTDALGNLVTKTQQPINYGAAFSGMGGQSFPTDVVTSDLPAPDTSSAELGLISEVLNAPTAQRPQVYKQSLNKAESMGIDVSHMPEEYDPEVLDSAFQEVIKNGDSIRGGQVGMVAKGNGVVNSPVAKAARVQEAAKEGVKSIKDIEDQALEASGQIEGFKKVYDVFNNGFKGGGGAWFENMALKAKGFLPGELSPEEKMFQQDYQLIQSQADLNVAKSIKTMFGGNISDGEREFARIIQALPVDTKEQALLKTATQEAGAMQKIRINALKDAWIQEYGAFEAKNSKGQSFSQYIGKYIQDNPILTPQFLAERGAIIPVKNRKDIESLPEGSRFINPSDGKIYRKTTQR